MSKASKLILEWIGRGGTGAKMADNLKLRRPLDAQQISLNESYEVSFWLTRLGLNKGDLPLLKHVVGLVGDDVGEVVQWFRRYGLGKFSRLRFR